MMKLIAATDLTHRGLITGEMRAKLLPKYKLLKKGSLVTSVTGAVSLAVVEFGKDVAVSSLKKYGYKFAALLLPGPTLAYCGGMLYTMTKWSRIRSLGVTIYNLGGAIIKGELILLDVALLIPDFILFGEYVPTFNDTSALCITNETEAVKELFFNNTFTKDFMSIYSPIVLGNVVE
jgi:hypothetical protein